MTDLNTACLLVHKCLAQICSAVQKYWGVTAQDRFKHRFIDQIKDVFSSGHEAKIFQTWQKWKTMKLDLPWSTYLPKYPYLQEDGTMIACWKLLHRVCHWKDKEDKSYIPNPPNASLQQHLQVSHSNCLRTVCSQWWQYLRIDPQSLVLDGTGMYWAPDSRSCASANAACTICFQDNGIGCPLKLEPDNPCNCLNIYTYVYIYIHTTYIIWRKMEVNPRESFTVSQFPGQKLRHPIEGSRHLATLS